MRMIRAGSIWQEVIARLRAWCRFRATLHELSNLPDCVLLDLGTSRLQLRRFAWQCARLGSIPVAEQRFKKGAIPGAGHYGGADLPGPRRLPSAQAQILGLVAAFVMLFANAGYLIAGEANFMRTCNSLFDERSFDCACAGKYIEGNTRQTIARFS